MEDLATIPKLSMTTEYKYMNVVSYTKIKRKEIPEFIHRRKYMIIKYKQSSLCSYKNNASLSVSTKNNKPEGNNTNKFLSRIDKEEGKTKKNVLRSFYKKLYHHSHKINSCINSHIHIIDKTTSNLHNLNNVCLSIVPPPTWGLDI